MIEIMTLVHMGVPLLVATCLSSVSSILTAPYTSWFPVVILAVLAGIAVLSIIYAIGPLVGNINTVRPWVKVKIYELLLSIVLILIFASIATALCTWNPVGAYGAVGLVSAQCSSATGTNPVNNVYSLALCNLKQFNNHVDNFNSYLFYTLLVLSVAPNFVFGTINLNPLSSTAINPLSTPSVQVTLEAGPIVLSPIAKGNNFESYAIPLVYLFILINQLQLLLLAAAPYLFAFFMALGLIARAFGVTRTFGGAMIAFGLGIGFLYPVLISLNYGFLDYALEHNIVTTPVGTIAGLALPVSPVLAYVQALGSYVIGGQVLSYFPEEFFIYLGIVIMGITFVNILDFVILDAFISDFSTAVGEKMDFLSLLTNVL